MDDPKLSVLLPTVNRPYYLERCLYSLAETYDPKILEVIVVCDDDAYSAKLAHGFQGRARFGKYRIFHTEERVYAVTAFNYALEHSTCEFFCWLTDLTVVRFKGWADYALKFFLEQFPDKIGVMSFLVDTGAGIGMTTKSFVKYNEGEWFHRKYKVHYPDPELTSRAILMGRFMCPAVDLVFFDKEAKKKNPAMDEKVRYVMIQEDKKLFSKRRELEFVLPHDKVVNPNYDILKFETVNLPLGRKLNV